MSIGETDGMDQKNISEVMANVKSSDTREGFIAGHIENWDDERGAGNGVIVTLRYGWSFDSYHHEGVRGFDTVREARRASAKKNVYRCACPLCAKATEQTP